MGQSAEVLVIRLVISCNQGMEGMMEIVIPLGIDAVAAHLRRTYDPGVVQIAFGNYIKRPSKEPAERMDCLGKLLQEMMGTEIEYALNCVNSEGVTW